MKKNLLLLSLAALLGVSACKTQEVAGDAIPTRVGEITIQPILHGSFAMNWNNKTILVDPYGGGDLYKGLPAPDMVLITDIHGDHLDLKTLETLNLHKATIIAPQAVVDMLPETMRSKAIDLANGEDTTTMNVRVIAVPMYNLPETPDSRHPKGRGNGYILDFKGRTVYISGDTEDIPEMENLKGIDVAFVCMNLPFTMDVDQAAAAVLKFKPRVVYPYHYRGQSGLSDVQAFKKKVDAGNQKIDVRLRKWYPTE
ncbi:beta-lactamase [Rufibacter sp. DG15C]|uniref:MBL fold metallo-hydrolase n=1 Tax=Rufibacter sp. DG15C TaxID=1379909 RepID=UPI00078E1A75|nr:MBL fold metallo-hydrolase [Rufibacter sp. DG15C]AMM52510.1 beta-lactamase [Rufibacter sp. DG15C]